MGREDGAASRGASRVASKQARYQGSRGNTQAGEAGEAGEAGGRADNYLHN